MMSRIMTAVDSVTLIGGLLAILVGLKAFYKIEKNAESLSARCADLDENLRKAGEHYTDALNGVCRNYDEKIERQQKEIEFLNHKIKEADAAMEQTGVEISEIAKILAEKVKAYNDEKKGP